jgi:hypothetical protein
MLINQREGPCESAGVHEAAKILGMASPSRYLSPDEVPSKTGLAR